ncbi:MAG: hypothetical protein ABS76_23205 [Pelagibacterium sp. SCN 64-44]|nr:MAG: hypothetical protein ABS76_23205 [Pelagibacterium sp. SCN 64-44]
MTTSKYTDKLILGPIPRQPRQARISLRYSAGKAAKGRMPETADLLQQSFDVLVRLTERDFLEARGVTAQVQASAPDRLDVRLAAERLPAELMVIALRLVIGANDNSPADFRRLLEALDGDMAAAQEVYAGTNFEEEVAGITLSAAGEGPATAFDPFWLDGEARLIRHSRRLIVRGWAAYMPDEANEDLILRLAGLGAFLPPGIRPDYEPGEEEYHPLGENLAIDRVSIEDASLRAILAMLAPEHEAALIEEE